MILYFLLKKKGCETGNKIHSNRCFLKYDFGIDTLLGIKIEGDVSENDNHRGKFYSNHGNGNRNFNNRLYR